MSAQQIFWYIKCVLGHNTPVWTRGYLIDPQQVNKILVSHTVKPICNDHLYNKIYYLWFIQ